MVEPLAGDERIHGAGVHIRLSGQRGRAVHPIAQLLPPLMFKQAALDFGQGQDRWHGRILLPRLPASQKQARLIHRDIRDTSAYPRIDTPCHRLEVIHG